MSTERTVENRRYLTELTTTVHRLRPLFVAVAVAAVTAVGCGLLAVRRRTRTGRSGPGATFTPTIRRVATAVLLVVACAPAGTFVAALSRWWVSGAPVVTAIVSSAVGATGLALVAWGVSRLMPRGFWRVAGATAGVTWLVLTIDGLTDTILQQGSILGEPPTLGDRYYGFGNTAFAVYAAASLVLAGTLASFALARGRRAAAVTVVVAVGLVAAIVDGWPGFGADFGGVLALVPAFGVLVPAVGGVALTKRRALITGLVTVGAVSVIAVIDWLRPGGRTHLGLFVQRVVDGEAVGVIWDKAAGAWATVANPAGAAAAVLCIVVCVVLVGPSRARPTSLQNAYARFPLVRSVVTAVVVAAVLGGFLNDSGVVVASVVLGVAGVLLAASWCAAIWFSAPEAVAPDVDARVLRMPAVVIATGGVLLGVLLLTTAVVVPASAVVAGDVARGSQSLVVHDGDRVVVIGMSGVRWQDVSRSQTPTLWALLRDGAAAGGVTQGATGRDARCAAGGWLALSSGNAPVTGAVVNGKWACTPSWTEPDEDSEGAVVANWDALQDLQTSSGSRSRLGVLAESLAGTGACATAVGRGAALALADDSGEVERYRDLDAALADPQDAFSCQVTLVDAGSAPQAREASGPPVEDDARSTALSDIDATVRQVMADAPLGAVVMIVDVGDPTAAQPWLGVGLVDAGSRSTSRFLTASSTRWEGVVQLLDVPTTILAAVGADTPPQMAGSVIGAGGLRSSDLSRTVDELAVLTVRDHTMRGLSDALTTTPAFALLALSGLIVLLARRAPRADGVRSRWRSVVRGAVDGLALVVVSIPAGLFLMTTWLWWWVDSPAVGMWCALAASTMIVAGVGALVPRRPAYAAPAVVCAITAAVLTLDAAVGTPLHRGGPLGPAPTLGGRYYGFGIPTTVVYAVAMAVTAVGLATWLVRRGRRRFAVVAAVVVAVVTLLVDLWATSGVDISGGPVLAAGCAVVALTVAGAGVMWRVRAP